MAIQPQWAARRIHFELNLSAVHINADHDQLNQVWTNILSNSIKFSPEDGVIQVSLEQDTRNVIVRISDKGIGISAEDQKRIFERFFKADRSHSPSFLEKSVLARLLIKLSGDPYEGLPFDDETKKQMRMIMFKNLYNSSMMNEMEHIYTNFKAAEPLKFPKELPLILFVQAENADVKGWIPLHEEQATDSVHGAVIKLDGGHYLHHTHSKEIVEGFRKYMKDFELVS
ncbi:hypothetical protein GCM10010913_38120 [Paenibacillus aceti]|uniref:histidine kinase n=1 Tax=Paenibacillus aceti TaxID=1820010 RepID=A0ABQ1W3E0_9BACL|nr:hypothetical protein GCM10010913_38120 [Paenibacillus aceti]